MVDLLWADHRISDAGANHPSGQSDDEPTQSFVRVPSLGRHLSLQIAREISEFTFCVWCLFCISYASVTRFVPCRIAVPRHGRIDADNRAAILFLTIVSILR